MSAERHLPNVVNLSKAPEATGIYIGRKWAGREASPWANPFPVGTDTPERRREVVWQYVLDLMQRDQRLALPELIQDDPPNIPNHIYTKPLLCWCAPGLCHGHALVFLASRIELHGTPCPACGQPVRSVLNIYDDRGEEKQTWKLYETTICPFNPEPGKSLPHRQYFARGEIRIAAIEEHAKKW